MVDVLNPSVRNAIEGHPPTISAGLPICVDLDGTLITTDMLVETALAVLRHNWLNALKFPFWLSRGKAFLKHKIAELADFNPATLPYNPQILDFIEAERAKGRKILLVTASDHRIAQCIAAHLGLFDEVIASDGTRNLKGDEKARILVERFGQFGYDYVGNDRSDLAVWQHASQAVVVNAPKSVARAAESLSQSAKVLSTRTAHLPEFLRALRCHQWSKNILIFVPAIAAHTGHHPAVATATFFMFLAFCAAASGTYIINDLSDIEDDRAHPRKRNRPFASGSLPLTYGVFGPVLMLLGIAIGYTISVWAMGLLILYVVVAQAYTAKLKRQPLVDVFTLASLYTLRLFVGGVASGVGVSIWLLSFAGFLFLSLAFLKRTAEFVATRGTEDADTPRRGYYPSDLPALQLMGVASSFAASLVLALYVDSHNAELAYATPIVLWALVPLFLFWQCRLWLSTVRGYMNDDPIVYAARDRVSWLVFIGIVGAFGVASLGVPFMVS